MESWAKHKIADLTLKSKQRDPRKEPEEYFKYVDVSSVSRESYRIVDYTNTKGKDAPSRARKIIQTDDVIFATVRPTLMRIALVPSEFHNEICSTGYCVLKPNVKLVNPAFLYYSVLPDYFISKIGKLQRGASYPAIRDTDLKNQVISVPPLPIQRTITRILSTVQKAIEKQDRLIRTTTEMKKALMQKLFTEGVRGEKQKETEIGLVPESWEVERIGDMYEFTKKPKGLKIDYPVPFVPMELVPLDKIYITDFDLRDKVSSGTYVENGNMLLAKITPSFENGKQGILQIEKAVGYATTEVIPIKQIENISDKYFLFYYLLKDDVRVSLADKMEGSTGRQRLSKNVVEETLIPKPTIEEQKEIGKIFLTLHERIGIYQKKKQILTDLFKTLLHELMTGQIDVSQWDQKEEQLPMAAEPEVEYDNIKNI